MRTRRADSFFEPLEPRTLFSSIAWDGGGDGTTLNQAANWAGDVLPGPSDDAVINVAGTPAITFSSGSLSINSLSCAEAFTQSGGTLTIAAASAFSGPLTQIAGILNGTGDLTISSTFNWTGGTIGGSGTATLSASCTATFSGVSTLGVNRNFVNAGTVNWTGANLGGFSGPGITFTNNATFNANLSSPYSLAANTAPNTFVNNGTFTKSGASTLSIDGFAFNSPGSLSVAAGTLKFAAGGTITGAVSVAAGATINHSFGTLAYNAGASFSGAGAWTVTNGTTSFNLPFSPAGLFSVSNGTVNLNSSQSISSLSVSGGTLAGSGDITITGTLAWTGGIIAGSGTLFIAPAAAANLGPGSMGVNRNITNSGTVNWTNGTLGGQFGNGVTFTNDGTFNAATAVDAYFNGNSTPNAFVNHGTFHKTGATVLTFANTSLTSTGTLLIDAGSLVLTAGGGLSGPITLASGVSLDLSGGTFTHGALNLSGAGQLRFEGGTHSLGATLTLGVHTIVDNATLNGPGDIAINAPFDWNNGTIAGGGIATIAPGITLTMATYATKNLGRTLVNNGRVEHSLGYLQLTGNAALNNSAGHVYNLTQTGNLYFINSNNAVNNAGVFNFNTSSDPVITCPFNNSGTLNIFQGTIDMNAGGTNSGPRNIAAGARLRYHASYTHNAGSTTGGSGTLVLDGGTQTVGGNWTLASYAQLLQGALSGPGNLTLGGPLSWGAGSISGPGSLIITAQGKLALTTYADHILARTIANHGQLHFLNGSWHFNGTTITSDGTIALLPSGTVAVSGGVNAITSSGVLRKMSSTTLALDSALGGISLSNTGIVDVRNGTLNLNGPVAQLAGGTLSAGTWQVYPTGGLGLPSAVHTVASGVVINMIGANASFPALANLTTNNGALNFSLGGVFQTTPVGGTFTNNGAISLTEDRWFQVNGSFIQSASGSAAMSLLSTSRFSRLIATGAAALAGSVSFSFVNSFAPASGDSFTILQAGSRTGQFSNVGIPSLTSHLNYSTTAAQLVIA